MKLLEKFADVNGLEVKIIRGNAAHAEFTESYLPAFLKFIANFEDEYEAEIKRKETEVNNDPERGQ
jgi:hypothetical protein